MQGHPGQIVKHVLWYNMFPLRRSGTRAVAAAATVAMIGGLPVFLVGGVSVFVAADLEFDEFQLGLAVSGYYAAASMCGLLFGRLGDRIGPRRLLVLAAGIGCATLCGIGLSWSWASLAAWLVVGGVVNSLSQLAASLNISYRVPAARLGLAVAVKQAAVPAATLLAGVAVPTVALTLGWRWVFGFAGLGTLVAAVVLAAGRRQPVPARAGAGSGLGPVRGPLVVLAVACAFGAMSLTVLGSFFVSYAVSIGMPVGVAGLVLAAGSVGAIAVRLVAGWGADRRPGRSLREASALLAVGGVALAVLPFVASWPAVTLVLVVAFAAGTGWPGLLNLAVLRIGPHAPAAATGITFTGSSIGCVVGPALFGFVAARGGFTVAWLVTASSLIMCAGLMLLGRHRVRTVQRRLAEISVGGSA
jgi:MFS family permease